MVIERRMVRASPYTSRVQRGRTFSQTTANDTDERFCMAVASKMQYVVNTDGQACHKTASTVHEDGVWLGAGIIDAKGK